MAMTFYYSNCTVIDVGCYLYYDSNATLPVDNGYYSDGTYVYTITDGNGLIKAKDNC